MVLQAHDIRRGFWCTGIAIAAVQKALNLFNTPPEHDAYKKKKTFCLEQQGHHGSGQENNRRLQLLEYLHHLLDRRYNAQNTIMMTQ